MKAIFNTLLNKFNSSKQIQINISLQGIALNKKLLDLNYLNKNARSYRQADTNNDNIFYIDDEQGISYLYSAENKTVDLRLRLAEEPNYEQGYERKYKKSYFEFRPKGIFNGLLSINNNEISFSQDELCHKRLNNSSVSKFIGNYCIEFSYVAELDKAFLKLERQHGIKIRSTDAEYAEFNRQKLELINNYSGSIFREVVIWEKVPEPAKAKRTSSGKWKHPEFTGEALHFDNFYFKLLIVEELMFHQQKLLPKFDVNDFCEDYAEREIDIEEHYFEIIPEVKKWFEELKIPVEYAQYVEHIYSDGGNEFYEQLIPYWDGSWDMFDIEDISERELAQFPNLKEIETFNLTDKAKEVCRKKGIHLVHD